MAVAMIAPYYDYSGVPPMVIAKVFLLCLLIALYGVSCLNLGLNGSRGLAVFLFVTPMVLFVLAIIYGG